MPSGRTPQFGFAVEEGKCAARIIRKGDDSRRTTALWLLAFQFIVGYNDASTLFKARMPTKSKTIPAASTMDKIREWANRWQGVLVLVSLAVGTVIFLVDFSSRLNILRSDVDKNAAETKDLSNKLDTLSKRIDTTNQRIDQLYLRNESSLGKLIPKPDVARALPPSDLKARFQQASLVVTSDLQKQMPQNPEVVKQIRHDLATTLNDAQLPRDVHQAGVNALVHIEAYLVFCLRAAVPVTPAVLPEGKMMLAGGGNPHPELRIGGIWNVGKGQDKTQFIIAPSFPAPSLFYIDSPSVMTDLSIVTLASARADLEALTLRGENATAVISQVTIQGLSQDLTKIAWLNVTFQGDIIRYNGGPLYLANAHFVRCKFEFGNDAISQKVLSEIESHNSQGITLVEGY